LANILEQGKMRQRVVTVGDANPDIIFTGLTNMPRAEQDTLASGLEVVLGGQTATISRAMTHLGLEVAFVGRVGDDYYGRWAVQQLQADGVNTSGMVIDPGLRTGATVVLSTGAERAFATYIGSIAEVRRSDITEEILSAADHLHVGSYFLQRRLHPDMLNLLQEAKRRGLTTSVDPGWDNFLEWDAGIMEVLPLVDVFLPNLVEAQQITGAGAAEAALDVLARQGNIVVVKMGGEGCLVRHRDSGFHAPGFQVDVVDVTSAGDIFNAGFLYGFLAGWELERAARFANACGAIAVSQVGSAGIISGVAQVEEFITCHAFGEGLY
jgi:sugar/nucleoside kinase (ribokinase family)